MSENYNKKTIIDFKKEKKAYDEEHPEPDDESTPEPTFTKNPDENKTEYNEDDDNTDDDKPKPDKLNDWFKDILKNNIFYPRKSFYIGGNRRFPSQPSLHDVSSNATQDTTS